MDEGNYPQSSDDFIYTRYGNPSVCAAEAAIADLEQSDWAVLTSSGMSAIDVALSIFQEGVRSGPWLFFSELYGGTKFYVKEILERRRGIRVETIEPVADHYDTGKVRKAIESLRPRVLFLESVSNPLLIVPEARKIIGIAAEHNARLLEEGDESGQGGRMRVIVDNTFGTPLLWKPLEDGADLVVHSATKYLGGHGNLTAGVVCGKDSVLKREAMRYRKLVGNILSPDDANRLESQLKTFKLRFSRQCDNAARLAPLLEGYRDKVVRVLYPGLSSHPSHGEAMGLFEGKGFGAMITFQLAGETPECARATCDAFVEAIRDRVAYVPTLGDFNSILLHVSTVFGEKQDPSGGMIRLSVGCESWEDLRAAFTDALERIQVHPV